MAAGCLILEGYQDENKYDIFIFATHNERLKCLSKEMLAKVWQIRKDEAMSMLEFTSQLNHQDPDSSLSRKSGTNDCMLQYNIIDI